MSGKRVQKTTKSDIQENKKPQPRQVKTSEIILTANLKCKNKTQKDLIHSIQSKDTTLCIGPAGTGKTYLSCYEALHQLKTNSKIHKIILIKSITTLKSEEIGYLKGDLNEKMEPFVYSFIGNIKKLVPFEVFNFLMSIGKIEVLPIAYLRGANLDNSIIIVDEIQNITIDNMKTILTRLGDDSKIILLGDKNQIDLKDKSQTCINYLLDKFRNVPNEHVGVVEFFEEDIVRHRLTNYFIEIFKDAEKKPEKLIPPKKPELRIIKQPEKESFLKKVKKFLKFTNF